jgi:chloramphenicol-sensitive protein RarD
MKKGVGLSVGASVLFALLYYYATLLRPLEGTEIFAWRVLLGFPVLAVFITRLKRWAEVGLMLRRMFSDIRYMVLQVICAILFGLQMWVFVWAPLHGKALEVSMGYFLLPLMMVLTGRVFYKEQLSTLQRIAVALAFVGVLHELLRTYSFSWATALVAFGYPPYFVIRRYLKVGSLSSLFFDFGFLLIPSFYILYTQDISVAQKFGEYARLYWQVPIFGAISALALLGYLTASRLLPLGLFGILGYVEPVLLFWVAFLLLGEPVQSHEWYTYIPIWLAVLLVAVEGFVAWRKDQKSKEAEGK